MVIEQQGGNMSMLSDRAFLMEAPLLTRLEQQLESCRMPREWAILRAQQAIYMARTHRISEAQEIPGELRRRFLGREEAEVFYWIWLLEAVLSFYVSGITGGRRHLDCARAFAAALKRLDLQEYVEAWAAHCSFMGNDLVGLQKSLLSSNLDRAVIPEARCRAALIAAVSWQTAGKGTSADVWFGKAREIARSIGDRATIMASIENRASGRLNDIWLNHFFGVDPSDQLDAVETEMRGALAYESVTGSDAVPQQAVIMRARIYYLRAEYYECERLLRTSVSDFPVPNYSILRSIDIWLDWIEVLNGADARSKFRSIEVCEERFDSLDLDDSAVSWKMAGLIANSCGDQAVRANCFGRAQECLVRYLEYKSRIHQVISSVCGVPGES